MSVLNKLTEGIVHRDLAKEGDALLSKWEKTGLLEGLEKDSSRQGMARLLENQAKQLLKEASSMAGGDVEGFASVAFPLVRRVFGGKVVASQLTGGVDLGEEIPNASLETVVGAGAESGFYGLNNGYSSPTGSFLSFTPAVSTNIAAADGFAGGSADLNTFTAIDSFSEGQKKAIRFDPDIMAMSGSSNGTLKMIQVDLTVSVAQRAFMNFENMTAFELREDATETVPGIVSIGGGNDDIHPVRRLTFRPQIDLIRFTLLGTANSADGDATAATCDLIYPMVDQFAVGGALGSVKGTTTWGLEGADNTSTAAYDSIERDKIPEIDIKVDSIAVTAITKKLKAKWTPELGQDLNAYHNLDAEVELTSGWC